MADYSGSGIKDLPLTTPSSLQWGDPRVIGWLMEAIEEGDRINRADPSYDVIERAQLYITGEQLSPERQRLKYLPQVIINESRKAMQAHVSALTDLKPVFGWKTLNPAQYQRHADLLNQYAVAEWVTGLYDLDLGDCIKYALSAGTGDLVVDWDPHAPLGGMNQLRATDPRDTLAIRPSMARSIQSWEGLILREEHSINALKGMYPTRQNLFVPSSDTALGRVMGKFRTAAARLLTPADPLDALGQRGVHTRKTRSGNVVLYRAYLKDRTKNLTGRGIVMGTPGAAWSYIAAPNEPLYPRGRCIIFTDTAILYDGPSTYMHGLFPVCRLRLWSVPWQFLGIPLFNDLLPVQDAINDTVNDLRLAAKQWVDPDIVYNRNAVSKATMRTLDPKRPGKRLDVAPGFGEPYQKLDGVNPQVMQILSELWEKLTTKFNDMSGTANLQALLQLRQVPSADTIEKYYEALTPEIRMEARQVEAFMRDLSEMIKGNYFQFLDDATRRMVLGDAGVLFEDFDADAHQMIPATPLGSNGYVAELDPALRTRDERAQFFSKQFVFVVAPNSILAMDATERKMMTFQETRMGFCDFWTFHEVMGTPNVGQPPAIPLPPLKPPSPEVQQLLMQGAALAQLGVPPQPVVDPLTKESFILDPASGQIAQIRVPTTITERLQAQQMLGIGMMANPAGRKASGDAPPKMESKDGGTRQTVTESSK